MRTRLGAVVCAAAALVIAWSWQRSDAASTGGTQIAVEATATYADAMRNAYATASNTVVATVAQIGSIVVSPKETSPNASLETAPSNQIVTRTFLIANTSNISDAYQVVKLTAGTLKITGAVFSQNGVTQDAMDDAISPTVAPAGSLQVVVSIQTGSLQLGTQVPVDIAVQTTASGTINGIQSDSGQEWIVGSTPPQITGPGGSATEVSKTVNNTTVLQSSPGATVTYAIQAANTGGSPAVNASVVDTVPTGMTYVPGTVKVNGQPPAPGAVTVSGQTLSVAVGTLAAGATVNVSFQATVTSAQVLGVTFVNVASIQAAGVPPQTTTPASVLAGTANTVFNGFNGPQDPVGGATVTLYDANFNIVNLNGGVPASLVRALSAAGISRQDSVEGNTENPFHTGPDGAYGFALSPSLIAPGGSTFYLTIVSPNYLNRKIRLDITPGAGNLLYNVKSTSLDGQPLAAAGGYDLVGQGTTLNNVFGLFGNMPVFQASTISVSKSADRQTAAPGDRIIFTVTFADTSTRSLGVGTIVDMLPPGLAYADGSARVDGQSDEPKIAGRALTWSVPALATNVQHTLEYAAVVFPGIPPATVLTNSVAVSGAVAGTVASVAGSATTAITIVSGMFDDRRIVTGRVFVDTRGTGHFAKGDRGIAGVRVVMEDGSFALTDQNGRFSFPSVRPGMHVLRIDPISLPPGVHPFAAASPFSTRTTQRLLHGLLDDDTMEDVEFALQGAAQ